MNRRFEAVVIGAGQAGPPMAGRIAASGKTVAVIERKLIGGTCVNDGCTPTKTLVASAYAAHLARRAHDFGVRPDRSASILAPSWPARMRSSAIPVRTSRLGSMASRTAP